MTWQADIRRPASFRGVPFLTAEAEARVGRRNVVHEYPQRDVPFTEDLGRRARQFMVEALVVGADYIAQRDALMAAIEQAGPGQLDHPRWGVLQVVVQDYVSVKESHREGGMARFAITFVEHGANQFPRVASDTAAQVERGAAELDNQAATAFGQSFDVAGPGVLAADALTALQADLDRSLRTARQVTSTADLAQWMTTLGGLTGSLTDLMRTPVVLAQRLVGLRVQLAATINRPLQALAEFETVFGLNTRAALPTEGLRTTRTRGLANAAARADLQRRLCLAAAARALALALEDATITAERARQLRSRFTALLDTELEQYDPAAPVVRALGQLRAAVARDVAERAELLRQASTHTPVAVLPALVLAHRIYQDASRADELVARNAVRHPAFVPALALEVLR